jgi:glyoxylase-like metal-dependent hydrolase (beta-lactamase superfamily II)/8-oxo-dGTP pyrophosphatase MutT (NUDIX family)
MNKIIDAVSIILTHGEEIFVIQRQNYLKAFPGYWAFPGGKVEKEDSEFDFEHDLLVDFDKKLLGAVVREGNEELGINLIELFEQGIVTSIHLLGCAITPDFNPLRFSTYFFKLELLKKPEFEVDFNEAKRATWLTPENLLLMYSRGDMLAVPPVVKVIEELRRDFKIQSIENLNFHYNNQSYVPYIESVKAVRQIMPLSNTLPPADRTNAFLIGDNDSLKCLVDPSPLDEEYEKFKNTINLFGLDAILITHHHPDHHQNATKLARGYQIPIYLSEYTFRKLTSKDHDYFLEIEIKLLKEGDFLTKWLGHDVVIFEVPGHDEGQIAIAPKNLSWFLAGDLFQGIGTVVIGDEEGDMAKYFDTLQKVIDLNPKVLFPSHGIALGGIDILERTLEHRKVRENQVLMLHNHGKSIPEILEKIYQDTPAPLLPFARKNIEKHLEKLKKEGRI